MTYKISPGNILSSHVQKYNILDIGYYERALPISKATPIFHVNVYASRMKKVYPTTINTAVSTKFISFL